MIEPTEIIMKKATAEGRSAVFSSSRDNGPRGLVELVNGLRCAWQGVVRPFLVFMIAIFARTVYPEDQGQTHHHQSTDHKKQPRVALTDQCQAHRRAYGHADRISEGKHPQALRHPTFGNDISSHG